MISSENTFAVVVWFNPTAEQTTNLATYLYRVCHTIVVDNSESPHDDLLHSFPADRYTYLPQCSNRGIATALNIGCRAALDQGAQWVLTMDQDSHWDQQQLTYYLQATNEYPEHDKVGVFSPRQDYTGHTRHYTEDYEQKMAVMTSGSLLSARGFTATQGFRDEWFIDEVDNEYCMHIRHLGMLVVVVNNALLAHHLGVIRQIRFLGFWKKEYVDHSPIRYYYIVRNNLALSKLYPENEHFNNHRLTKMVKRIVLYDNVHRWRSLYYCARGLQDYHRRHFGMFAR